MLKCANGFGLCLQKGKKAPQNHVSILLAERLTTDLFRLGVLFSHYGPRNILQRIVLLPSKNYSFIYAQLFGNLKARIIKSIITWSKMGQQTTQSKKVYSFATQIIQLHVLANILWISWPLLVTCKKKKKMTYSPLTPPLYTNTVTRHKASFQLPRTLSSPSSPSRFLNCAWRSSDRHGLTFQTQSRITEISVHSNER